MASKFIKAHPPSITTSVVIDESSVAWKLFNAFVNDPNATVTIDELYSYGINELKLPEEGMAPELKENLPVILLAFMNMWSGWHFKNEYLAGKFPKEHYFERFQKFMVHKMSTTIKGQFAAALKAVADQLKLNNPEVRLEPEFSPYAIQIECPASMLNTIAFSNLGDDVIMKQHLGSTWHELSTVQLLNWPFVEVMFRNEDICLVRRQATEFTRYLNFLPHESSKEMDAIVEHAEALPSYGRNRTCYSYNFLDKYLKSYVQVLKTNYSKIGSGKIEEISAILGQFLEDVKYIDVNNSIATNTIILFRLSRVPFIRNKKLVKNAEKESDEARVGYCEIITPKIELVLMYCKAAQVVDANHVTFEYVEKLKNQKLNDSEVMPFISYKCSFCRMEFNEDDAQKRMLLHLKNEHKMEQHVRCTMCKKQFDVLNLSACRWRHKCVVAQAATKQ